MLPELRAPRPTITPQTALDDLPAVLRVHQVAQWLDVSPGSVYTTISEGKLPAVRVGRVLRVHRDALAAFVAGHQAARRDEVVSPAGTTRRRRG